jgi:DUF438 domain-containing protein
MPTLQAAQHDQILDHATKAAIQQAEEDYPRVFEQERLLDIATAHARLLMAETKPEDGAALCTLYIGVFKAAYRLRRHALSATPTAAAQRHSL